MSKKLTIFTPTYNRAHTISRVYKSILQQEKKLLSQIEWLIVDDGSTDDTELIISEWSKEDLPFDLRYIKQKNGGKHIAFNRAVNEAQGEFFFTVDSDGWQIIVLSIYLIWYQAYRKLRTWLALLL